MTTEPKNEDEIARRAHQIWEAEGRPEGRADDHWHRATEQHAAEGGGGAPRPVQPGFADAAPGMVPDAAPAAEIEEAPGGRFAEQLDDLPDTDTPADTRARGAEN